MSLVISKPEGALKPCSLHLMPFHVAHDGPAPISTYFRPKPTTESFPGQDGTPTTEDAPPDVTEEVKEDTIKTDDQDESTPAIDSLPPSSDMSASASDSRRLTASFRGRTMQGLRVDLPQGYSGIILRPPIISNIADNTSTSTSTSATPSTVEKAKESRAKKDAAAAKARAKRASRRAKHAGVTIDPEEEEAPAADAMVVDEPADNVPAEVHDMAMVDEKDDGSKSRVLRPTAKFSSFVLWNPDIAVDEGRDEYLRSLTEWVDIAAEVRPIFSRRRMERSSSD
jgi:hypothetical protein